MTSCTWSFESVLDPVSLGTFRDEYWDRKLLRISRRDRSFYDGLISLDELEQCLGQKGFFARNHLTTPLQGRGAPEPPPASRGETYERLLSGHSLRFRHMEDFLQPASAIMQLANDMTATLQHPIESLSCYIARENALGLGPHHDETDIFTLQISGSKRWRFFHRARSTEAATYADGSLGEPTADFTLEAGDLLYIPRGLVHDVVAMEGAFSITVVFDSFKWTSVLELLSDRLEESSLIDAIPAGVLLSKDHRSALAAEMATRLNTIRLAVDNISMDDLLDTLAERQVARMWRPASHHFRDLLQLGEITLQTRVERDKSLPYHFSVRACRVRLMLPGGELLQASDRVEPAFKKILAASGGFRVLDIDDSLGSDAKIALAAKLIGCGLLKPCMGET